MEGTGKTGSFVYPHPCLPAGRLALPLKREGGDMENFNGKFQIVLIKRKVRNL
jgi:hypothetical protein